MKYIVLVGDGMADYPLVELGKRTPLEAARIPNMNYMATEGVAGLARTIPSGMSPASDVAIMNVLGYPPKQFYPGRGPLEAANMDIELKENEVAFRCNLITAADDILADYSAGHVKSDEARMLIKALNEHLSNDYIKFYPGVGYRHLMVIGEHAAEGVGKAKCVPPHDIMGKKISQHLPKGSGSPVLIDLMKRSRDVLSAHEVNKVRIDLRENPANMIWLWGQGKACRLPGFSERFGVKGACISAVDLIKGFGKMIGMKVVDVPGATGYYDTDYKGKARAAMKSLRTSDLVFVHVEAPDEASHNADLREKILAIERFDREIAGAALKYCEKTADARVLIMPDHATPISVRTHTSDDVPFLVYGAGVDRNDVMGFNESSVKKSSHVFKRGHELMSFFLGKPPARRS